MSAQANGMSSANAVPPSRCMTPERPVERWRAPTRRRCAETETNLALFRSRRRAHKWMPSTSTAHDAGVTQGDAWRLRRRACPSGLKRKQARIIPLTAARCLSETSLQEMTPTDTPSLPYAVGICLCLDAVVKFRGKAVRTGPSKRPRYSSRFGRHGHAFGKRIADR